MVCDAIQAYQNFDSEMESLQLSLEMQQSIFQLQCRNVLSKTGLLRTELDCLLKLELDEVWKRRTSVAFESALTNALGKHGTVWLRCVGQVSEQVVKIRKRIQSVHKRTKSFGSYIKAERVRSVLLGKMPRIKKDIRELGDFNTNLNFLTEEIFSVANRRVCASNYHSAPDIPCALSVYREIGKAGRELYDALSTSCKQHSIHVAHLSLQPAQKVVGHGTLSFNIRFDAREDSEFGAAENWFNITSTVRQIDPASNPPPNPPSNSPSNPAPGPSRPSKQRTAWCEAVANTVTGGDNATTNTTTTDVVIRPPPVNGNLPLALPSTLGALFASDVAGESVEESQSEWDLCRRICKLPQSSTIDIKAAKTCTYSYCASLAARSEPLQPISLGQIFDKTKGLPSHIEGLSQLSRLDVARLLAEATLQHGTSLWIPDRWRSREVIFYVDPNAELEFSYDAVELPSPFVERQVAKQGCMTAEVAPSSVRNPVLYNLAILFLELAYQAPLLSLDRSGKQLEKLETETLAEKEFRLARQYSGLSSGTLGRRFKRLIYKLLWCDFGCGSADLKDINLQERFYSDIILGIEEIEDTLRQDLS